MAKQVTTPYTQPSIAGVPTYASQHLPGYVPVAVKIYGGTAYAPPDNYTWTYRAVNLMAQNILKNPAASGRPENWPDDVLGRWEHIVARNYGQDEIFAGDMMALWQYMQRYYQPKPGDFFQERLGAYIPPSERDYMLDPELATMLVAQENLARAEQLSAIERDFKRYQIEAELQLKRASQAINTSAVNAAINQAERRLLAAVEQAGGGGGGYGGRHGRGCGGGGYVCDPDLALKQAKLALDWQIALWNREADKERLALDRMRIEADIAYKNALLAQAEREMQIKRAQINAQVLANPNDRLQMEYMLRGQVAGGAREPVGMPVDIYTGQASGGPSTFSVTQGQNYFNAGVEPFSIGPGQYNFPGGVTVGFAGGTQYETRDDSVFIVGEDTKAKDGLGKTAEIVVNVDGGRFAVIPNARKYVRRISEAMYAPRKR